MEAALLSTIRIPVEEAARGGRVAVMPFAENELDRLSESVDVVG
jgi:hypothetical protein